MKLVAILIRLLTWPIIILITIINLISYLWIGVIPEFHMLWKCDNAYRIKKVEPFLKENKLL